MAFMQYMSEKHQFAIFHWEEFHTSLQIPSRAVQTFFEQSVGLIDTGRFIGSLDISIPTRVDTIIEVSDNSQIFRILGCHRILYHRSLHVADDTMVIQTLSSIHHVQIKQGRTFFIDVRSRQIQNVLSFRLLSPRGCITETDSIICIRTIPVQ